MNESNYTLATPHCAFRLLEDEAKTRFATILDPDPRKQVRLLALLGPLHMVGTKASPVELFSIPYSEAPPDRLVPPPPPPKPKIPKALTRQFQRELNELKAIVSGAKMEGLYCAEDQTRNHAVRREVLVLKYSIVMPNARMAPWNQEALEAILNCVDESVDLIDSLAFLKAIKFARALIVGLFPRLKPKMNKVEVALVASVAEQIAKRRSPRHLIANHGRRGVKAKLRKRPV